MKAKTKYLYGEVMPEPIKDEIINNRINLLNNNLSELLKVHYTVRDDQRINDILKAINFWKSINNS